jgi:pyruvate dehydrogenase E1 component alpha subunit
MANDSQQEKTTDGVDEHAAGDDVTLDDTAGDGAALEEDVPEGPWTRQSMDIPSEAIVDERTFQTYPADTVTHDDLGLDAETVVEMYRSMLLQRRFEERCRQMYQRQKISGFLHLYIGQEAVSTGSVEAIRLGEDSVITAYRDHGMGLAMGLDPGACMAELFGKASGVSSGKGGSMHFFGDEQRMFGGHAIVGAHIPLGAGIAFAHKYRGEDNVCLCFFGDGAINQGAFHEAANLAGLYDLPLVMICENNQYGMGTAVDRAAAEPDLFKRAVSYDIPGALVSGMDVFSVQKAVQDHVDLARDGTPSLLEIRTYRYQGHSISDPAKYRAEGELEDRKTGDSIVRLQRYMTEHGLATDDELDAIDEELKQTVLDAIDFAEESDFPDEEALYEHVYAQEDYPFLN